MIYPGSHSLMERDDRFLHRCHRSGDAALRSIYWWVRQGTWVTAGSGLTGVTLRTDSPIFPLVSRFSLDSAAGGQWPLSYCTERPGYGNTCPQDDLLTHTAPVPSSYVGLRTGGRAWGTG